MTTNKPGWTRNMPETERAELERLLMEDWQQRIDGTLPPNHLLKLISALCQVPSSVDWTVWDKIGAEEAAEPQLTDDERDMLREPVAIPRPGLSDELIARTMLANCDRETPELSDRLRAMLKLDD